METDWNKLMNQSSYCNFCREITETKEWDCLICGFSKVILEDKGHYSNMKYQVRILSGHGTEESFHFETKKEADAFVKGFDYAQFCHDDYEAEVDELEYT